jgi:hypothetical protein
LPKHGYSRDKRSDCKQICIGLCVTSRNVNAVCTAEFSNVDISPAGSVTGDWKSQDIGIENNAPEQLYVALQDSSNNSAVVKYSDPAATTIDTWTQWDIPLTSFTGVNLQAIRLRRTHSLEAQVIYTLMISGCVYPRLTSSS